jgi:hypothetical protein
MALVVMFETYARDTTGKDMREVVRSRPVLQTYDDLRAFRDALIRESLPSEEPQPATDKADPAPRVVTPATLATLVRVGQEQSLNRRADWRVRDEHTCIEQEWNTGVVSVEVSADREYALVPARLHHHRAGQPIDPHWRCDLYVRGEDRFERQQIVLDVFVRDFDSLPKLTEE